MSRARDGATRFSDRVADYVKYRPRYPDAAIDAIVTAAQISKGAAIADVGSGTGISSRPFVERGFRVFGVEPNTEMRAAAESELASFSNFTSVDGSAEKTTLADSSVELVVAAQAFHWFRSDDARAEVLRVSRAPHTCALVWNERLVDTAFLRAYEAALFAHAIDYANVDHRNVDADRLRAFFRGPFETLQVENSQRFDRAGFIGRAMSSSYVPREGHLQHAAMMAALERTFVEHRDDERRVEFRYATFVHVGRLVT